MPPELYRIESAGSGWVSTMARPRGGDWLFDEMQSLANSGVTLLVSLLTAEEVSELDLTNEPNAAREAGISFISLPVGDRAVPQKSQFVKAIEFAVAELKEGGHVVAHCRMGIGRSSLFAAGLLVRQGMAHEEAWSEINKARGLKVPDTEEQKSWLVDLTFNRP